MRLNFMFVAVPALFGAAFLLLADDLPKLDWCHFPPGQWTGDPATSPFNVLNIDENGISGHQNHLGDGPVTVTVTYKGTTYTPLGATCGGPSCGTASGPSGRVNLVPCGKTGNAACAAVGGSTGSAPSAGTCTCPTGTGFAGGLPMDGSCGLISH